MKKKCVVLHRKKLRVVNETMGWSRKGQAFKRGLLVALLILIFFLVLWLLMKPFAGFLS